MKKTEENLLFHFPFLIEKYAVGVPLRFTVKESIVFETEFPLGLRCCVWLTLTFN